MMFPITVTFAFYRPTNKHILQLYMPSWHRLITKMYWLTDADSTHNWKSLE